MDNFLHAGNPIGEELSYTHDITVCLEKVNAQIIPTFRNNIRCFVKAPTTGQETWTKCSIQATPSGRRCFVHWFLQSTKTGQYIDPPKIIKHKKSIVTCPILVFLIKISPSPQRAQHSVRWRIVMVAQKRWFCMNFDFRVGAE